jgi:GNAT superfamily N-acetyltransferase
VAFTVRRATLEDTPAILVCLRSAFAPFECNYTPPAYADTILNHDTLVERFTAMSIFVAQDESGIIIGTIGCGLEGQGVGHLRGMAVSPDCQGKGVAEKLLNRAEAELRGLGCVRVTLDTTAPLKRAVRFYQRHGYLRTGRVSDFFSMPLFEYAKSL